MTATELDGVQLTLPTPWQQPLAGCDLHLASGGGSGAAVWRVTRGNVLEGFLKSEAVDDFSELPAEVDRLRWLRDNRVPAPEVLDALEQYQRHWLWMSAVPGTALAYSTALTPPEAVEILADALRKLHRLPIAACPFNHRLPLRMAAARARNQAGRVDPADFDPVRQGQTTAQLYGALVAQAPRKADLVVTHGDAGLANMMAAHARFSGFIDCGRFGVADRHQDLALAARSVARELGEEWVPPFFRHYGITPDPALLDFYCLLDEFF